MSNTEGLILAQTALGKRIRMLRKEQRLSQPAFAVLCKLHVSHLGKIEGGKANPSLESLLTIARAFGMTAADLLAGIPEADAADNSEQPAEPSSNSNEAPPGEPTKTPRAV